MKIQPAEMLMNWDHPVHGQMREVLCKAHVSEVLAAVKALGIGCIAEIARDKPPCSRCAAHAENIPMRDYVKTRRN